MTFWLIWPGTRRKTACRFLHTSRHRCRLPGWDIRAPPGCRSSITGSPMKSPIPGRGDKYHSETLIRLPQGFLCYGPPEDAPGVSGLPARKNGHITFGSFNNLPKINPEVIGLWSRLLQQVPDSCLLLKSKQFADDHVRQRFLDLFSACGIAAERMRLLPRVASTAGHLAVYHQVDIGLDPFPYNGTTTTCEALWMGVPVITLRRRSSCRPGGGQYFDPGRPERAYRKE